MLPVYFGAHFFLPVQPYSDRPSRILGVANPKTGLRFVLYSVSRLLPNCWNKETLASYVLVVVGNYLREISRPAQRQPMHL